MCFVPARLMDVSYLCRALERMGATLALSVLKECGVGGLVPVVVLHRMTIHVQHNERVYAFGGYGEDEGQMIVYPSCVSRVLGVPRSMDMAIVRDVNAGIIVYVTRDMWMEHLYDYPVD